MNYPEEKNLNERSLRAINLFHEIARGAHENNWKIAFLSGFAIDAHVGYITRNHRDVDIITTRETMPHLRQYLSQLGHTVYEPDNVKNECLKVDQADPEKESSAHADLHYFWEEEGKVVIPLLGKKLVFSGDFQHITREAEFLGEKITVLTSRHLIEEKKGWCEQVGLSRCRDYPKEYQAELEKIMSLL